MTVALPERLDLTEIRRLECDFDAFRRFRIEPCQRLGLSSDSLPHHSESCASPGSVQVDQALSEWLSRRRWTCSSRATANSRSPRPRRCWPGWSGLIRGKAEADLAALARQPDLDPMLALLTLPVQKEPDLGPCAQRILARRPDLIELIVPILSERFQGLSPSQLMATLGISKDFWRHTRAFQDILAEGRQDGVELGRQEGREEGRELGLEEGRRRQASALALRQLERRCGSLEVPTSSRIEALILPQLEELALALLEFRGAQDLQTWLEQLEP